MIGQLSGFTHLIISLIILFLVSPYIMRIINYLIVGKESTVEEIEYKKTLEESYAFMNDRR